MMSIRTSFLIAFACLSFLECQQSFAEPMQWSSGDGGNDHHYEFIQVADPYTGSNNSWGADSAAAAASIFHGYSGHLATVASQEENDFLLSLVPGGFSEGAGAWLGGKAPEGWLEGPEAGEAFTFTNWGGSEPNNIGYAYMIVGSAFVGINPGEWADDSGVQGVPDPTGDRVIGYFVEYETTAAVPEPSSAMLFAFGLVGLVVLMRKRLPSRA